jgi:hypothetical protein
MGRRVVLLARVLTVAAVLVLVWALVMHPTAPTVAGPDRIDCGSLRTVLRTDAGPHVGELRPDQDAFDRRCVERAHQKVAAAGFALPVLLAGWAVLGAQARRRRRGSQPRNSSLVG